MRMGHAPLFHIWLIIQGPRHCAPGRGESPEISIRVNGVNIAGPAFTCLL